MSAGVHPPMPPGTAGTPFEGGRGGGGSGGMRWLKSISEEAVISTRGQALPSIIQSHSVTDLYKLGRRGTVSPRRPGSPRGSIQFENASDLELGKSKTHDGLSMMGSNKFNFDSFPAPPSDFPLVRGSHAFGWDTPHDERRASVLFTPQMRSQRLIGNSNPRYKWHQYYKSPEELKKMRRALRQYYERNNYLIGQFMYIDKLLDSSIPRNLIDEYTDAELNIPATILEEVAASPAGASPSTPYTSTSSSQDARSASFSSVAPVKMVRTPQNLYKVPTADENTPLLNNRVKDEDDDEEEEEPLHDSNGKRLPTISAVPVLKPDEEAESSSEMVTFAIYLNFAANTALLVLKIIVTVMTSSLSVLASLVDAALDFLSTFIVWVTTRIISRSDSENYEKYPVGRQRLEPIGVLVFSIIMITSFFQVGLKALNRLYSGDHEVVQLSLSAVAIMATTVLVKFICWQWCRRVKNSSVQALAQDAMTDVVFNTFSIIFPLLGYFTSTWWLDPLGGLLLSLYVIVSWSITTKQHINNLTGCAASSDQLNILLYLTMRFAKTIKYIQGIQAYHVGDRLNVEVDIVLDEEMSLRDSHDLGESLQYVLESVPGVERAFVHTDYRSVNLPSHMRRS